MDEETRTEQEYTESADRMEALAVGIGTLLRNHSDSPLTIKTAIAMVANELVPAVQRFEAAREIHRPRVRRRLHRARNPVAEPPIQ